jgi:hypothetical protein
LLALLWFVPPILLCLALLSPALASAFFLIWAVGFSLDLYSTWRFYAEDKGEFEVKERSLFMRWLNRKLGFGRALLAFTLFVEAPVALFLSFVCVPVSAELVDVKPPGLQTCVAVGLAIYGLIHLYAAANNFAIEFTEEETHAAFDAHA